MKQQNKNTLPSEADSSLFHSSYFYLYAAYTTHTCKHVHAHDAHACPVPEPEHEHGGRSGLQCRYIYVCTFIRVYNALLYKYCVHTYTVRSGSC